MALVSELGPHRPLTDFAFARISGTFERSSATAIDPEPTFVGSD